LGCAVFPILSGFLLFFVPESPQFLVEKGRMEEARKALAWFRGFSPASPQVGNELEEVNYISIIIPFRFGSECSRK